MKMKNLLRQAAMIAALFALGAQPADAQFSKFVKKAKKAVETVAGTANAVTGGGREVAIATGGTMINPLASSLDFELVGAYGKTKSELFGDVILVFKINAKEDVSRVGFGGSIDAAKSMAVDNTGKSYVNGTLGQQFFDVVPGVQIRVKLDNMYQIIEGVKRSATTLQNVRLGVFVTNNAKGMITLKNVPILWDVDPDADPAPAAEAQP